MFEFKLWNWVYNFSEFIQFPMNFGRFGSIWIIHIKSKVKWKKLLCTWAKTGRSSLAWLWPRIGFRPSPHEQESAPPRRSCGSAGGGPAGSGLPATRCVGEAARSSSTTRWTGLRGHPGRRLTGGGHPRQRRSSGGEPVAAARTSGRGVARVVGEVHGTDAELIEVEARADPAGGGPSAWRRSRGEEDSTCGVALRTTVRRGWWADEVRVDKTKLVAAMSGPEGGRKRLVRWGVHGGKQMASA
jgi:hypothetical protein